MNACSSWCGYCGRCTDGDGPSREERAERKTPEQELQEFQQALHRSEQDSIAMRARWAAQDAAKQKGAA